MKRMARVSSRDQKGVERGEGEREGRRGEARVYLFYEFGLRVMHAVGGVHPPGLPGRPFAHVAFRFTRALAPFLPRQGGGVRLRLLVEHPLQSPPLLLLLFSLSCPIPPPLRCRAGVWRVGPC